MTDPTGPRVVAIGGGHGLAMSLRAIRTYAGHLTAIVATGDDGGSSGRIRAELDMPAPGDLRRCLSALASDQTVAAGLEHRFRHGQLAGHAVGNLVLAGLVDAGHDLVGAADLVSEWLGIDTGSIRVLPATAGAVGLVSTTDDGDEVRGQVAVEAASDVRAISFDPPSPSVLDEAVHAIGASEQIVIGPGSFFTSVLGAIVPDLAKVIDAADATVVLVANLDHDAARQITLLGEHGVSVDVVVVQEGNEVGPVDGVRVVFADVVRSHGLAHDPALLAPVLDSR